MRGTTLQQADLPKVAMVGGGWWRDGYWMATRRPLDGREVTGSGDFRRNGAKGRLNCLVSPHDCVVKARVMSALAELLGSKVKAEVFRLLFGAGEGRLHLRELARQRHGMVEPLGGSA